MFLIKCLVRLAAAMSLVAMIQMFYKPALNPAMLIVEIGMIVLWISSELSWKKKGV